MSKKFILFLVEGKNDEREIGAILHTPVFDRFRDKYQPIILPNGGDITMSPNSIQGKLNNQLLSFRKSGVPFHNIRVDEIQEFVQIVDTDGVFIPSENVVRGGSSSFLYTDTTIITTNDCGAVGRNRKKAEILRTLSTIDQVGNVPYSVYYASCNMDHVLFGNRNPPPNVKTGCSWGFVEKCASDPSILNESIFKPGIMAEGTYADSWSFIQQGCNSLQRHTNFNLFFSEKAKNKK
ncbi:MAG: hypothetical protein IKP74_03485 [Clostridia bacterium]|nr:hypothetical protein [Clostridia bacterium]